MNEALPELLQGVVQELLARFERLEALEAEVAKLREPQRKRPAKPKRSGQESL